MFHCFCEMVGTGIGKEKGETVGGPVASTKTRHPPTGVGLLEGWTGRWSGR